MDYTQQVKSDKKMRKANPVVLWGVGAAALVLLGAYMLSGSSNASLGDLKVGSDGKLTPAQTATIKDKVGKLIVPPQEEPVMAVVTAADSLVKEQAFYNGVENGDILLIYPQAGKAVLYSTKRDRLLNVGPVQVGADTKKDAPAADAKKQ